MLDKTDLCSRPVRRHLHSCVKQKWNYCKAKKNSTIKIFYLPLWKAPAILLVNICVQICLKLLWSEENIGDGITYCWIFLCCNTVKGKMVGFSFAPWLVISSCPPVTATTITARSSPLSLTAPCVLPHFSTCLTNIIYWCCEIWSYE